MKLDELDAATLMRAVTIYCAAAYQAEEVADRVRKAVPKPQAHFAEILGWLIDESDRAESDGHRRYVMRLGNKNYPCMKLVLEEFLYPGEFYFFVDTHDEVDLDPKAPEYDAWQELRGFNSDVKRKVETAWWNAGIATIRDLKDLVAGHAAHQGCRPRDDDEDPMQTVMVVDDDPDLADTTRLALETHGYRTVAVADVGNVLAEAERLNPHAILVDAAVGGLSGRKICKELRENNCTAHIPLALVAPRLQFFRGVPEADACLFKPFDADQLYRMVDHLISQRPGDDLDPE